MKQAIRLALRDLRGSKAGLRLLALCLFLGVAALAGIGSLSSAILGGLSERGQAILGGDIQLETVQRVAGPDELTAMQRLGTVSQTVRMRAMAARADSGESVLAELKAVDGPYPLYGTFRLAPGALAERPTGLDIAVAPSLAAQLNLKTGDALLVNQTRFRVIGLIAEEPDRTGEGLSYGGVMIVDSAGMAATGLVQPGSLYSARYRIKLPASANPVAVNAAFVKAFPAGGWKASDRSNGAPSTKRFIENLGQFLALVGLTALAVAGIGVGNGVSGWLDGKRQSIATFKVLGASSGTIFQTYLIQIVIVAGVAVAAGLAAGAALPWAIVAMAGDRLPVTPNLALYPAPLGLAALDGLLIALLFSLAPLARARSVTAASLFRTWVEGARWPTWPVQAAIAITALIIAALAIATAKEPVFAAVFVACVVALLAVLAGLGTAIRALAARLPRPDAPLVRLAIANLHRPGAQTGRLVVALGLGLTLFATLATVQTSLDRQIATAIPKRAPSFFALDIAKQDEAGFRAAIIAAAPGADIATVPMLRGPVVAIGARRVSEMKDLPPEAWFLRGDRGLTFARDLPPGSTVTQGQWWPADYAGPPLVSLDERAAKAVGLTVGDHLTIAVLGVEIEARIASLRTIKWETMGFNFVLVFSPGSLEAAPYTLAATVAADARAEPAINRAVSRGYPAVSMIRVKDVIAQVSTLLGQLGMAISIAASVAVLAGVAVLIGAIAAARRSRSYDAVLLKLLGATRAQILLVQAMEYAALALILCLVALGIGSAAGWVAVTQVFELDWTPDWARVIGMVAAGGLGTLMLGLLGALPILATRPAAALREL
ncbi:MAG: hypothetical protein RL367_901 [Pseudomonadota bacterium]